jgi:hypothetical protein
MKEQKTTIRRTPTETVFRCLGLRKRLAEEDRWGLHDVAYLLITTTVLALWYFAWYAPMRGRGEVLNGRADELQGRLIAAERELYRVRSGLEALRKSDPEAWERAARVHLGWLKPGEVSDVPAWRRTHQAEEAVTKTTVPQANFAAPPANRGAAPKNENRQTENAGRRQRTTLVER